MIELECPEVGFGSRQWMMISLVAGFRQTLNLIATVSTNALNPDKASPFFWSQMDWEQPYPDRWSPNEADRKFVAGYDGPNPSFLKGCAL